MKPVRNPEVKTLLLTYKKKKNLIKRRLSDFKKIKGGRDKKIFAELCFCLCTPQSKAVSCSAAIRRLEDTKTLFTGTDRKIAGYLKGLVRFHNNKAKYIVAARKVFCGADSPLEQNTDPKEIRRWLVKNIKGLGLKEASHFLRNIGLGNDLAIIDRHVLTNLKRHGAIKGIPAHISDKKYLELEEIMRKFSEKIKIPLADLDLLFWSNQTGHVFK